LSYAPHAPLTQAAKEAPGTIGVTLVGMVIVCLVGQFAMSLLAISLIDVMSDDRESAFEHIGDTWAEALVVLLAFVGWLFVLSATVARLHRRGLVGLCSNTGCAGLVGPFLRVAPALLALNALLLVVQFASTDLSVSPNQPLGLWLGLLPLATGAVLLQVSTEELVFRGYIQQHFSAFLPRPWMWIGVPALAFGAMHYNAAAGDSGPWLLLAAVLFGLCAGDLVARTGSLGPAIALHFCTNFSALVVVGLDGGMSGLALYTYPFDITDADTITRLMPAETLAIVINWLAARLLLRC